MEPFEYAVANGFDAFEWFPDKHGGAGWDEADLTAALRAGIRDSARDAGIRSSVHARLAASPLHPDAYAWFWKDLELATDLGAVLLNIHLCHLQGLAAYAEGIRPLLRRTAEAGLALAIENMPEHSPEMFNELFARLRGLGGDPTAHVGMCLDLGHANLCAATQNRYLEFVDRLDPQVPIIHLHLHENWGDADSHVPLFTGPSSNDDSGIRGLIARLQRRRFAGSIILEQWPQPPSLLNEARDRLRRMLGATASEVQSPKSKVKAQATAGTVPGSAGGPASELPQGFAGELVAADRQRPSWREKLEWVGQALARETPPLTEEELGDIAVYLRFLGTGEIQCAEDGRHFRPAHHARLASRIQQQLARLETPAKAFLARRIYPWLPSSAAPFRRAEPLTRIRDIAHRNDIPAELKREIKHSLQNKLHRCAGPEDLATATALLKRFTAPGANYPPAFVAEFKIFHAELKEFFSASSLEERLNRLLARVGAREAGLIRSFLTLKQALSPPEARPEVRDAGIRSGTAGLVMPAPGLGSALRALAALTELRCICLGPAGEILGPERHPGTPAAAPLFVSVGGQSGRRAVALEPPTDMNDSESWAAGAQEFLLTDIGLEDFAFVLLSQTNNALESDGGVSLGVHPRPRTQARSVFESEAGEDEQLTGWRAWLELLRLAVANVGLGGSGAEECEAINSELRAWSRDFQLAGREELLRLKATVDRSRRLAEEQSERILALYSRRAEALGRTLGVAEDATRIFCEEEVRGHTIFQLSRLAASLARRLRLELALPPWDVLVGGRAVGRVQAVGCIEDLNEALAEPALVLLRRAEGDEEIPRNVAGIVLAHDLPHLSHLGVRARQAGVVFVVCEERAIFEKLAAVQGQLASLTATPEMVEWQNADDSALESRAPAWAEPLNGRDQCRGSPRRMQIPAQRPAPKRPCVALDQLAPGAGGGKADGAKRLAELARQAGAGFSTPPALVVPLGIMERALQAAPGLEAEYRELSRQAEHMAGEDLAVAAERLRDLIRRLSVPGEIVAEAGRTFGEQARLMVRSSANCEDLAEMAGAGLYESVANVALAEVPAAVRTVWCSLWTRRAALSRQQSGIPHAQAQMAVLMQPTLAAELSFVLHTVNPHNHNRGEIFAEIAVGLGETLASGARRGNPWRLVCDKHSGVVRTLAYANFGQALRPAASGGLARETVDYSRARLSCDPGARTELGRRLAAIGQSVEEAFQQPQDIEGVVVGAEVFLVQTRAQQG